MPAEPNFDPSAASRSDRRTDVRLTNLSFRLNQPSGCEEFISPKGEVDGGLSMNGGGIKKRNLHIVLFDKKRDLRAAEDNPLCTTS